MMRTAVDDGLILRSPCRIKGGGQERSAERPTASVAEVELIAQAMPERMRMPVLLSACCGLRRGEVLALQRRDLNLEICSVKIERAAQHFTDGRVYVGPPKTAAGVLVVHFPRHIAYDLVVHLEVYAGTEPTALVFAAEHSGVLRPHVIYQHWTRAVNVAGRPELHFHDLWAVSSGQRNELT
jgi:integrase